MMPMDAACGTVKLTSPQSVIAKAPINVKKMPNCAAPPKKATFGFAIMGPKSVIAPMPIKISSGKMLGGAMPRL